MQVKKYKNVLDFFCHVLGECAWHEWRQFANNRIDARFVVGECVGVNHAGLLLFCNPGELCKRGFFLFVVRSVPEFHHLFKVGELVARKVHGVCDSREPDAAQAAFAFANQLQVRGRGESEEKKKISPSKA